MVHSTEMGMINNQRKVLEDVLDHLDKTWTSHLTAPWRD
jgi:hypothetical protein